MRLSISNIAWDQSEDEIVSALLLRYGVTAIDIAPGKYFPSIAEASEVDISHVRSRWNDRGIEIVGMQALTYGTTGLNIFGGAESRVALLRHLEAVFRIADGLGSRKLVFGSPKCRDRGELSDAEAEQQAVDFFQRAGELAARWNVFLCLEPNPPQYSCNFMMRTSEAAHIVSAVDHPHIRLQLDTGAMAIQQEHPEQIVLDYAPLVGHIHASEPGLVTLGEAGANHHAFSAALWHSSPDVIVAIEMVASADKPHLPEIERALQFGVPIYTEGGRS